MWPVRGECEQQPDLLRPAQATAGDLYVPGGHPIRLRRVDSDKDDRRSKKQRHFAHEVDDAFRRRAKAITHRGVKVKCVSVKEIVNGQERDTGRVDLNISYRISGSPVRLRVHTWGDRWVWVDLRSGSKGGCVWAHTVEADSSLRTERVISLSAWRRRSMRHGRLRRMW